MKELLIKHIYTEMQCIKDSMQKNKNEKFGINKLQIIVPNFC